MPSLCSQSRTSWRGPLILHRDTVCLCNNYLNLLSQSRADLLKLLQVDEKSHPVVGRVSEWHPRPLPPPPTLSRGFKTHGRAAQRAGSRTRGRWAARRGSWARLRLVPFPAVSHHVYFVRRQRRVVLTSCNDRYGLEALGGEWKWVKMGILGACLNQTTKAGLAPAGVTATPGVTGIGINPTNPRNAPSGVGGGAVKPRHPARPPLPPARLGKSLCRPRQRRAGELGSCRRCRPAPSSLPAGSGGRGGLCQPLLPAVVLWSAALAISAHLTQPGSASASDKEAAPIGRKFCTPAEVPGWVQQRLATPRLPKRGVLGSSRLSWGTETSADPLPAQGKARQWCLCQPRTLPGACLPTATLDGAEAGVRVPGVQGGLCAAATLCWGGPGDSRAVVRAGAGRCGLLLFVREKREPAGCGRCRRHGRELVAEPGMGWGG